MDPTPVLDLEAGNVSMVQRRTIRKLAEALGVAPPQILANEEGTSR